MKCATPGCTREPLRSSVGNVYRYCASCTAAVLHAAFAAPEPRRWYERARAHTLPTSVVGGLPSDAPSGAGTRVLPPGALPSGSAEAAREAA